MRSVTASVVSHRHGAMVSRLVKDLLACEEVAEVLVRLNVPEPIDLPEGRVRLFENEAPRGFGANHNANLASAEGDYFAVLNPDIHLSENPFSLLLPVVAADGCGVVAPVIVTPAGVGEDNARRFPTVRGLVRKLISGYRGVDEGSEDGGVHHPDWVAGMFLLFAREAFELVGGFDERYFLYYEDVDICARLRKAGYEVCLAKEVRAIHDARRESRRSWRFARWHLSSMMRYFAIHWGRLPRRTR